MIQFLQNNVLIQKMPFCCETELFGNWTLSEFSQQGFWAQPPEMCKSVKPFDWLNTRLYIKWIAFNVSIVEEGFAFREKIVELEICWKSSQK